MIEIIGDPNKEEKVLEPALRCITCAEPLVCVDGVYVHDYTGIGVKLAQVPKDLVEDASIAMASRCAGMDLVKTIVEPPAIFDIPEGTVWDHLLEEWVDPLDENGDNKGLEVVNQYGGSAGSLDQGKPAHKMNLVNSAMLIYFAEEIEISEISWINSEEKAMREWRLR